MFFRRAKTNATRHRQRRRKPFQSRLGVEHLERRDLLAIVWVNQGVGDDNADGFDIYTTQYRETARAIVRRAIDDWNRVITDFNYAEDNDSNPNNDLDNEFHLTILAEELTNDRRDNILLDDMVYNSEDKPIATTIHLDDDGGGAPGPGWFFDETPMDDVEFTALGNSFAATLVDVNGQTTRREDFYRTLVHSIGHALGLIQDLTNEESAITSMLKPLYKDSGLTDSQTDPTGISVGSLYYFRSTRTTPQFNVNATFVIGSHLYEGDLYGTNDDPAIVYFQGPSGVESATFLTHPNDLMNRRQASTAGNLDPNDPTPRETSRQFISDLDVKILADAYGYSVVLPSTLNTAHAMLDVWIGTLLVQGGARDNSTGTGVNDTIQLERVTDAAGDDVQVTVSYGGKTFTERVPFADVTNIVVHGNGGTDSISVNSNVSATKPWQEVQYVVSSNQDAIETSSTIGEGSLIDGIVDLSSIIPGSQTTLRAAVCAHGSFRFDSPCSMFRIAA